MNKDSCILIVDDLPSARKVLTRQLRHLGYQNIVEVADGQAALSLADQSKFDLVISDWLMPKMDGLELLAKLREMPKCAGTEFLFITSANTKDDVTEAFKRGVRNYLAKPFTTQMLEEKLNNLERGDSDLKN